MQVIETAIPDVKIFVPASHEDARGTLSETFNERRFEPYAPGLKFVQDNESYSAKIFTLRGLHYQAPPAAQAKLVRCTSGRVHDVAVDARKGSPTYGAWVGEELSASNRRQLFVPAGFLHGFMTLEPGSVVAYKVSAFYDKNADGAVHWASPSLAIAWPARSDQVIVSEKDAAAIDFAEFRSPFGF